MRAAPMTLVSKIRRHVSASTSARRASGPMAGAYTRASMPPRPLAAAATVDPDRRAVDEDVAHAAGLLRGQALGVGREVAHPSRRAGRHGLRVEDAHVGPGALSEIAAAHEAEDVGRLAGQLAHRPLERHEL